jgi:hypothetical protein
MILSDARQHLYDAVVPRMDSEDFIDKVDKALNSVLERFINSGKWEGTIQEIEIPTTEDFITLPRRFKACLAAKCVKDESSSTVQIQNQWYRYMAGVPNVGIALGSGYQEVNDLGDGFVTYADSPYDVYQLKFTRTNAGDSNVQILVKGYDENGTRIFTDAGSYSYEGTKINLTTIETTTSQKFSRQIFFLQKQLSQGYIYLDAVEVGSGEITRLGVYEPGETVVNYRRYYTGDLKGSYDAVRAICKIRFIPALVESDEIIPSNLGALRKGLSAIKAESSGDEERYTMYLNSGLLILNAELKENRGGTKFTLKINPDAYQFYRLNL